MKDYILETVCETQGCENKDKVINFFYCEPPWVDVIIEDWRGEEEDYCPLCKQLGILQDPYLED